VRSITSGAAARWHISLYGSQYIPPQARPLVTSTPKSTPSDRLGPRGAPSGEGRKKRVLTRAAPSVTRSIADAVVLKDGDVFFLTQPDGQVPPGPGHGFGLYYHDCRFLNAYGLQLGGAAPLVLGSTAKAGCDAIFELTNEDGAAGDRDRIPKETLGIRWQRTLDGTTLRLDECFTLRNWSHEPVDVPVEVRFDADFADVFTVRGLVPERQGTRHPPEWEEDRLVFRYDGADGVSRTLRVSFSPGMERRRERAAGWHCHVPARGSVQLTVRLSIAEAVRDSRERASGTRLAGVRVASDSELLNRIVARSLSDLDTLRTSLGGHEFFAAGVPWFVTLFGRDSLTAALQVLPFDPDTAADTLRLLASYQGTREDAWRDEEPGKILHELRVGELARTGAIPHSPYYGTVDATPLFLIVLGRLASWTGDLSLFEELRPNVERALEWMRRYGDVDGDGYIEYRSPPGGALINQGWKDSGDAIVDADGRIARPPIALVEVQGYAYAARQEIARLYRRSGDAATAERLEEEARLLRARFNQDFWVERTGCYALALDGDKTPLAVVSSNPGQALWAGIADEDKAGRVVDRLMADDMFNGWGVRTLAATERGYTPIGYHLGTVWPHDNSLIAAGFRRYGRGDAVARIFEGLTSAALGFEHLRLPELFTGFSRAEFDVPVRYPVACHPQAWAAGATPLLLQVLLGLAPDGFAKRLRLVHPMLPADVDRLEIGGIRLAGDTVALRLERGPGGSVAVQTVGPTEIDVVVEAGEQAPSAKGAD
jgi:glycogen debranching enzyme